MAPLDVLYNRGKSAIENKNINELQKIQAEVVSYIGNVKQLKDDDLKCLDLIKKEIFSHNPNQKVESTFDQICKRLRPPSNASSVVQLEWYIKGGGKGEKLFRDWETNPLSLSKEEKNKMSEIILTQLRKDPVKTLLKIRPNTSGTVLDDWKLKETLETFLDESDWGKEVLELGPNFSYVYAFGNGSISDAVESLIRQATVAALQFCGKKYDESEMEKKFPFETNHLGKYSVNVKNFSDSCGYGNQHKWCAFIHQTIQIASYKLGHKEWDFDNLIDFFQHRRAKIGKLNDDYKKGYGFPRKGNSQTDEMSMVTQCSDVYRQLGEHFQKCYSSELEPYLADTSSSSNESFQSHEIQLQAGNLPLETIRFHFITDDNDSDAKPMVYVELVHSPVKSIEPIMKRVKKLFTEAISTSAKDKKKLDLILGKIYWWICRAKPWVLGDPSIAEMLIKTIYATKGIEMPPWKEGIIPWAESVKANTAEEFAKEFPNFLGVHSQGK